MQTQIRTLSPGMRRSEGGTGRGGAVCYRASPSAASPRRGHGGRGSDREAKEAETHLFLRVMLAKFI